MATKFLAVLMVAVALDAGPAGCRGCNGDDYSPTYADLDTDTDTDIDTDSDTDTDTDPLTDAGIDGGLPDAGSKSRKANLSRSSVGVLIQYYESLKK